MLDNALNITTNKREELGIQNVIDLQFSSPLPGPEQGLKAMLQKVEDLLFVLDKNGRILHCKVRAGSILNIPPLRNDLNIQEILPAAIRRKYNLAVEKFQQDCRFNLFESMLLLPGAVNWYEFRLIPTLEQTMVLFIWKVNNYRSISQVVSNIPISIEKMLEGWSRSLYLRDFETEDHTRRVTKMAIKLARRLGLPEGDMMHIRRGAQVHDIGKIAIPDDILLKTGELAEEEWNAMRKHTLIAVDLLENIPQIEPALIIPRSHHEKWDGSGYPDGLAGENIPLHARIFAFADVYDALTSDRPYRRAWSQAEALVYIYRESGRHFDPALAPEFMRMMLQ